MLNFKLFNAQLISHKKHSCFTVAIIAFFVMLSNSFVYGQLKNFGSKALFKPEPNYHYSVYAYYDVVRESGIGVQLQIINKINLDVSGYLINKQSNLGGFIKQWDYYDLTGYGFSLKPKYLVSRLGRFYVGANIAYEALRHDKVWVEYNHGSSFNYINHNLEGAQGYAYTIGFTLGNKITYKHLFFEPFFGMGITSAKFTKTVYDENPRPSPVPNYPIVTSNYTNSYLQLNIGIKLGFSFKKSKKHEAIDKKFDEVYIPKSEAFGVYLNSVEATTKMTPKNLRKAINRYKRLNSSALRRYKISYTDTTNFFLKTDLLFEKIDDLIQGREPNKRLIKKP